MVFEHDPWWREAVVYEVYLRSFADASGDGVGDLPGVLGRLDHLFELGVDALWLTPFYRSPMADGGYDVADHFAVDPLFGVMADVDELLAAAHRLGLRVLVDVVPNHVSSEHSWFQAALAAGPGSPQRARFHFRPGKGPGAEAPPNDWQSDFGGPAWTRTFDEQGAPAEWYLHSFAPEQPDLNWDHSDVHDMFDRILKFWLDRGVDGIRIDVAHGLVKARGLPDNGANPAPAPPGVYQPWGHQWDQPGVHEVFRRWRALLNSYPGDRVAIGEVWVVDAQAMARYVRPDELHQVFNFHLLQAPWHAAALREVIEASLDAVAREGAPATWVLSNHDVVRHVSRYGGGAQGVARARAAALLMLALPGSVYLYQGEELGLPEVDLPDDALRDPTWERSGHARRGRDGCRVPLPWEAQAPNFGFAPGDVSTWLPMPADWGRHSAYEQRDVPSSMLSFYRAAIRLRRSNLAQCGQPLAWLNTLPEVVSFRRGDVVIATNLGTEPLLPPPGASLLIASADMSPNDALPCDATAWWSVDVSNPGCPG